MTELDGCALAGERPPLRRCCPKEGVGLVEVCSGGRGALRGMDVAGKYFCMYLKKSLTFAMSLSAVCPSEAALSRRYQSSLRREVGAKRKNANVDPVRFKISMGNFLLHLRLRFSNTSRGTSRTIVLRMSSVIVTMSPLCVWLGNSMVSEKLFLSETWTGNREFGWCVAGS